MITAHLPFGYLLGRAAQRYTPPHPWVMPAALIGAVLPDFDLLWFYFVDGRAFHHHLYWVHMPLFWVAVGAVTLPLVRMFQRPLLPVARTFFAALLTHCLLDTVGGDIAWFWPFSDRQFSLVTVEPTHSHFILSYLNHWTFSLELCIWAGAIFLFFRDRPA
ncbi:LexA-binding, inner membrane-associated putative hydrolase [Litoreibacter ponti]|uniref:LexA-binding, inner membrane-associated putative hydrolase n=1 Tax=Litoreibacter ponti TaxID=1510457 RepID=A0A2T6BIU3_9RHOB|nr:metal-dependent hydrolase [Litoreibacter ponti]PTX55981.1 LexA-binding, inner membrane-associated putative hydrolase [Litoreibacter ponti]